MQSGKYKTFYWIFQWRIQDFTNRLIWPNFLKNRMKIKKKLDPGGHVPGAPFGSVNVFDKTENLISKRLQKRQDRFSYVSNKSTISTLPIEKVTRLATKCLSFLKFMNIEKEVSSNIMTILIFKFFTLQLKIIWQLRMLLLHSRVLVQSKKSLFRSS